MKRRDEKMKELPGTRFVAEWRKIKLRGSAHHHLSASATLEFGCGFCLGRTRDGNLTNAGSNLKSQWSEVINRLQTLLPWSDAAAEAIQAEADSWHASTKSNESIKWSIKLTLTPFLFYRHEIQNSCEARFSNVKGSWNNFSLNLEITLCVIANYKLGITFCNYEYELWRHKDHSHD